MESPPRRDRRPREAEQVVDLRQAAASRNRGSEPPAAVPQPGDLDLVDQALLDGVRRHAAGEVVQALHELGRHVGSRRSRDTAREVEAAPPRLDAYDPAGTRVDRVVVHPGWTELHRDGVDAGLAGRAWTATDAHPHLARAAGLLLWAQTSGSTAMALSTSYAATAAVVGSPARGAWLPRLAPARPAGTSRRTAAGGRGRTTPTTDGAVGVGLSEPSSSSTAPTTVAVAELGGPLPGGPTWRLTGRKWFVGNADAHALVVDAATDDGVGTFLLPRALADGTANAVRTDRLRPGRARRAWVVGDLGLDLAWAVRLDTAGTPDPGPPASTGSSRSGSPALARLNAARDLDATVLAAAAVRGALYRAGHHVRHRVVGAGPLDTTALVRTLLADVAVESEAATTLALRLAAATDASRAGGGIRAVELAATTGHPDGGTAPATGGPAEEAALLRLAAPVAAAWLSRRAPQVTLEATELLAAAAWEAGGDLDRLHGDASAVLAGRTGNGLALHVVDVVSSDAEAVEAFLAECGRARGGDPRLDRTLLATADLLRAAAVEARKDRVAVQGAARWLVERCAVALQACLVLRHSPGPVADAYLGSRLDGSGNRGLGTLPLGSRRTTFVVDRALGDA